MQFVIKILEFEVYLMEGVDSPISDPSIFCTLPEVLSFFLPSISRIPFLHNTDDVVKERDVF